MPLWVDTTRQRWRARLACYLGRLGVVAVIAAFALDLTAAEFFNVFMGGCAAVGIGLVAALSVSCRVCSEFVMFNLWRDGYWLRMQPLETVHACPNCGARSNEESIV